MKSFLYIQITNREDFDGKDIKDLCVCNMADKQSENNFGWWQPPHVGGLERVKAADEKIMELMDYERLYNLVEKYFGFLNNHFWKEPIHKSLFDALGENSFLKKDLWTASVQVRDSLHILEEMARKTPAPSSLLVLPRHSGMPAKYHTSYDMMLEEGNRFSRSAILANQRAVKATMMEYNETFEEALPEGKRDEYKTKYTLVIEAFNSWRQKAEFAIKAWESSNVTVGHSSDGKSESKKMHFSQMLNELRKTLTN
jgi:hypothetical protein